MSPILGIYASSMQPALNATSYESIATVTVGAGGSSTITFSSIPSTYKHLQIRGISNNASGDYSTYMRFNGDSANNYSYHILTGNGSAASASATSSTSSMAIGVAGTGTSIFNAYVIDILDYTSTSKNKTLRSLTGSDYNGSGYMRFQSGLWFKTPEAITQIDIGYMFSGNFAQYSSFALYGVKG